MFLPEPTSFESALRAAKARSLLPTTGVTAELQQLDGAIKRRAMFSATVTSSRLLQQYDENIQELIDGKTDEATARLKIKQLLADMGYEPDPEQAGGIKDLSSDLRIGVTTDTNVATAQGYGWHILGQNREILKQWPAQELYRAMTRGHERDWAVRWARVGGKFYDGRMIAPKDDEIWDLIGSSRFFEDGLDNRWPPYAFGSGMDVRDIDWNESVALGVIAPEKVVEPSSDEFDADLKASVEVRAAGLFEAIAKQLAKDGIAARLIGGVLQFIG